MNELFNMEDIKIEKSGYFLKKMTFCGHSEKIYKCDNFFITIDNILINAIGNNEGGLYVKILSIKKNNIRYTNFRYHKKYICTVQDAIFEYYKMEV